MAWSRVVLALILVSASVAHAGELFNIGVTPTTPGPYQPGETVHVDLSWSQDGAFGDGAGGAINVRLMQFDFRNSSDELELSDFKWVWDGQAICAIVPALCGNLYTTDKSIPIVSAVYLGTSLDNLNQVVIPPNGGVRTATIDVALPLTPGDYDLNANSPAGGNPNAGARLGWGLGEPHPCKWFPCPYGGGLATLTVIPEPATLVLVTIGALGAMRHRRSKCCERLDG